GEALYRDKPTMKQHHGAKGTWSDAEYAHPGLQFIYLRLKSFQRFTESWALLERCSNRPPPQPALLSTPFPNPHTDPAPSSPIPLPLGTSLVWHEFEGHLSGAQLCGERNFRQILTFNGPRLCPPSHSASRQSGRRSWLRVVDVRMVHRVLGRYEGLLFSGEIGVAARSCLRRVRPEQGLLCSRGTKVGAGA
ncbi:MAG: hypothetical protein SGPRY_004460, partial [Prymnesium sp.]